MTFTSTFFILSVNISRIPAYRYMFVTLLLLQSSFIIVAFLVFSAETQRQLNYAWYKFIGLTGADDVQTFARKCYKSKKRGGQEKPHSSDELNRKRDGDELTTHADADGDNEECVSHQQLDKEDGYLKHVVDVHDDSQLQRRRHRQPQSPPLPPPPPQQQQQHRHRGHRHHHHQQQQQQLNLAESEDSDLSVVDGHFYQDFTSSDDDDEDADEFESDRAYGNDDDSPWNVQEHIYSEPADVDINDSKQPEENHVHREIDSNICSHISSTNHSDQQTADTVASTSAAAATPCTTATTSASCKRSLPPSLPHPPVIQSGDSSSSSASQLIDERR
ncbi:hypothetical protein HELRODRAFT_190792, partial [Helobdella robusta]|uniref:Uncharacterized protein n=1 Tax=Helobdella robusta TaxID=6412 RepID=T1FSA8_HELRO